MSLCLLCLYLATWVTIPSVLLSRKRPASMLAWIGATFCLPFLGPALYLAFGTDRLRRRRLKRHQRPRRRPAPQTPAPAPRLSGSEQSLVRAIAAINGNVLTGLDGLDILRDADAYYGDLLARMATARHHVHFQTYVWRKDETGRQFLAALCAVARRGVQVRLLLDELGSLDIKDSYFRPLIEAGGEFSWFYTIHPRRNRYFLNLRNHRKLQIIDGECAYIGGMNVGREYAGRDPSVGAWHDLQVRVTGDAVNDLQEIFANDWYFATTREFAGAPFFPTARRAASIPALLVESGPDSDRKPFLKSVIALCNAARRSIDLFTPYFVPVSAMIAAFQVAAARGVRVRLMVSEKNDVRFLVRIGRSYYDELMAFGVEIYEYSEAVHHAKAIIVDNHWLMVGSANLDARSIDLNFELNLLLRSAPVCAELNRVYTQMFTVCRKLDPARFQQRPRYEKLIEGLCRLWAPLL
jgi:cardiolipin synthase